MKVLVACEESQRVCIAFREKGHEAYSCDILEPSGGHPEWHIHGDVLKVIGGATVTTMDGLTHDIGKWDMMIAHPPCTDLAVSGARWFPEKQKDFRQQKSVAFFMRMVLADIPRLAVENPVGIMSSCYRKPDQIIQPYMFGDSARKTTCLWLKGLPKLIPTNIVSAGTIVTLSDGKTYSVEAHADMARDETGRILSWNDPLTGRLRSKTFWGIARAMAEQWGQL